jgi:murein DD-endopeptidase MepM/ murein hydrolase activator NlpD
MQQLRASFEGVRARVLRIFPERQIALHSEGRVRLVRIGTRAQIMAAGFTALVAGWMSIASVNMVATAGQDEALVAKEHELRRMSAQVAAMRASVNGLHGDVTATAQRLEQRQAFLAALLSGKANLNQLAAMMPKAGAAVVATASAGVANAGALLAPFSKLEQDQHAFVDRATVAAEARYRDMNALLRRLGLDSARFVGQSLLGIGGPMVPLSAPSSPMAGAEPKFAELFVSWKKVDQLEQAMLTIPAAVPAKSFSYSSSFGVRYDPFNGNAAMHAGVDMAGPHGEPILATADGVVSRASTFGGYGNCVDIDHGRGLSTRYGHLARYSVRPGDRVKKGEVIGYMGSTGRSTGTHLHYEVRVDGAAVNPMPFLQSSPQLLAIHERAVDHATGETQLASN